MYIWQCWRCRVSLFVWRCCAGSPAPPGMRAPASAQRRGEPAAQLLDFRASRRAALAGLALISSYISVRALVLGAKKVPANDVNVPGFDRHQTLIGDLCQCLNCIPTGLPVGSLPCLLILLLLFAPIAWAGRSSPAAQIPDSSCLLYTSPSPRDGLLSRMPSSA